jgi:hypothetical protein
MTVEDGIRWFMGPNTGVTPGKEWSAKADFRKFVYGYV